MDEKFYVGLALGMVGGALIVANSVKARQAVVDGQDQVIGKIEELKSAAKTKTTTKKGK